MKPADPRELPEWLQMDIEYHNRLRRHDRRAWFGVALLAVTAFGILGWGLYAGDVSSAADVEMHADERPLSP